MRVIMHQNYCEKCRDKSHKVSAKISFSVVIIGSTAEENFSIFCLIQVH